MKRKSAIITFELVNESAEENNQKIEQELMSWFSEEALSIPWVKTVREVSVKND
jgi:hypothetical protein